MLRHYLRTATRHLAREKGFAFLNLFGLALGLACFILIFRYVQYERSFDRFHAHADRIYRVAEIIEGSEESASQPFPAGPTLRADFPHLVEASVRFFNMQAPTVTLSYETPQGEERRHDEPRFFFVDATVFSVFSFPLLRGDPTTALTRPNTVVLTEAMAHRYFGDADPLGKTILLENAYPLEVTGLLAEVPPNAHFQFDFLAAFDTYRDIVPNRQWLERWQWNPAWTYLLLPEGVEPATLEAQFPAFVDRYFPDSFKSFTHLELQPLTDIHLHSRLHYEITPNGNAAYVQTFSVIALFVLLISCINFMNLKTARSAKRAREVGMRKVLGAHRSQLVRQFLGESVLMSVLALLVALPLVYLFLPVLNQWAGTAVTLDVFQQAELLLLLGGLVLVVGVFAGLYPALFLSAFRPVQVLKGTGAAGRSWAVLLRKGLVVAQFALSILLICGTMVAYAQLRYLRTADLGFDQEHVVVLTTMRTPIADVYPSFKQALLAHPQIRYATMSEDLPGQKHQTDAYTPAGHEAAQAHRLLVTEDFVETLDLAMVAGQSFREGLRAEHDRMALVNEAFLRMVGWERPEEALGVELNSSSRRKLTVVGVTEDFHYASLHTPVGPFVLESVQYKLGALHSIGRYMLVRIAPENVPATLAFIEAQWQQFLPHHPFDYAFLDVSLDQQYRSEALLGTIASIFALLAVLIACLGLFGLAAFSAAQRTKEIGVRKVVGASVQGVVWLLSKEYLLLVGVAMVIGWPLAYVLGEQWLSGFAYRTAVPWQPFLWSGVLALAIAGLTVSYQALRAALVNPVEALRYD